MPFSMRVDVVMSEDNEVTRVAGTVSAVWSAQSLGAAELVRPEHASVWGLGRSARSAR